MSEKKFVKKLEKLFVDDGFYTRREVGVGYGIADLVLFRPNNKKILKRIEYNQNSRLLSENYFKVLAHIVDSEMSQIPTHINEIQNKAALSENILRYSILPVLKKGGFIKEIEKNYYLKINGWLPIGRELVAIEAKLHDWRRGLMQAARYKAFAHRAYLAVPKNIAHNISRCIVEDYGVGLITFDAETNKKKVLVAPKKQQPKNLNKRDFAFEYFWSAEVRKGALS